jgi:hypothetical protein
MRLRTIAIAAFALLLPLAVLVGCVAWFLPRSEHEVQLVSTSRSPDGAWEASVVKVWNSDGWFITTVSDQIRLSSTRKPGEGVEMMWMDAVGAVPFDPLLAWAASNVLQVTVPNLSEIGVRRREFGGVHLDLRFDPPDPAARKAWLDKYFPGYQDEIPAGAGK